MQSTLAKYKYDVKSRPRAPARSSSWFETSEADKFATPRVAAGVLYRDNAGRVLLVKPTYKDGWEIPGGYVERGESPHAAADVASNAGGRCLAAEASSSIQAARSPQMSHCWYA